MISPTNVLLLWLAAADGLSMVSVLIFNAVQNYLDENMYGPLNAVWISLVSTHAAIFTHSVAIWMAVVLGFFRALVVYFPFHAKRVCTITKVNIAAALVTVLMAVAATPSVYVHMISDVNNTDSDNTTRAQHFIGTRSSWWWNANTILHAVACRLLPCLLLLVLNVLLIRGMYVAKRHRARLSASTTRCRIATVAAGSTSAVSVGRCRIATVAAGSTSAVSVGRCRIATVAAGSTSAVSVGRCRIATVAAGSTSAVSVGRCRIATVAAGSTSAVSVGRCRIATVGAGSTSAVSVGRCRIDTVAAGSTSAVSVGDSFNGRRPDNQGGSSHIRRSDNQGRISHRRCSDNQGGSSTGMLLAVVALSVLTETPQGVLLLLGTVHLSVYLVVYQRLGDFLDTLTIFNSSLNFVLYCAMSNKFRKTFVDLFRKNFVNCLNAISNKG